jgi:prepilin-type N-terminal cleavage/methylation domain-containing protein
MKLSTSSTRRQAFTLIELLVVIAIIGILFTLVSPQLSKARMHAKLTQQADKAQSIVEAITAKESGSRFSGNVWPQSDSEFSFSSAAEFLSSLVEDGYLDVEYSWFAAPGMTPARTRAEFLANPRLHNAWNIIMDLKDTTPGNYPAVFTKNLSISGTELSFSETESPFGNKGFAFSTKNGEGNSVGEAEINSPDFKYIFNLKDRAVTVLGY